MTRIAIISDSQFDIGPDIASWPGSGAASGFNIAHNKLPYELRRRGHTSIELQQRETGGRGFLVPGNSFDDDDIEFAIQSGASHCVIVGGTNDIGSPSWDQANYQAAVRTFIEKLFFGTTLVSPFDTGGRSKIAHVFKCSPPIIEEVNASDPNGNYVAATATALDEALASDALLEAWWNNTYPDLAGRLKYVNIHDVAMGGDRSIADNVLAPWFTYDGTHWGAFWQADVSEQLANEISPTLQAGAGSGLKFNRAKIFGNGRMA